ncbi:Acetyl esterase/lipase [Mesorhizobium albiziae]|uniref:Acetyl esterase/lipase n=1 Tax=Neomesorhizobium albiziae TaxID=335020 RepID=A0A1I3WPF9_9HYPH|nr:alpha/beta hydrolase [Mesorhizobium albiziae]GLS31752.1 esterase [Mesorhizobium albiziae]SFK08757.1 Acetyl esterase/lipase [Mesorhizobium albiziae]
MIHRRVSNWDDAYSNAINIPGGDRWPAAWIGPAEAYRDAMSAKGRAKLDIAYGERERNRFDLFLPQGMPKGLVVYIHGGWWKAFDKSVWSHLASGAVDSGYAVAMPSYTLCPEVRIRDITREIARAVETAAEMIDGPIMLTGHSAGGHLATRMVTTTSPLSRAVAGRVRHVLSIAGLHDLRTVMRIPMYRELNVDEAEALAESPALLSPIENTRLTCWVGAAERAEFIRQNALLANIWTGLGAETATVEEPDRHHFTIVDGLADAAHPLTKTLLTA